MRRIISEIHRRSVWQVLGIYVLGSWIGYQVILSLWEGLGLPSWVPPLAIILFIVGLPIVLATAIVQEGHPLRLRDQGGRGADAGRLDGLQTAADVLSPTDIRAAGERVPPASASSSSAAGLAGILTWARAIRAGVLAFALLGLAATGFLGMRSFGIGPAATLVSSGQLDERSMLVLADFTADDPDMAEVVTEALRIDLHQSTAMNLADASYLADVLRRMERDPSQPLTPDIAREIAEREGFDAVITGEVRGLGGRYLLSARVEGPDGSVLAALRSDADDEASLLEAVDALSTRIREKVGESLRSVRRSEPLEAVSTSSLEALRLYSRAVKLENATGDEVRTAELFARATDVDSTFAMAWRKLAISLSNAGADPVRAAHAYTRAFELRDRLPDQERYMAEGSYHKQLTGDIEAAAQAYRTLLGINPDHPAALNNLAIIELERGRWEEASRLMRRTAAIEPRPAALGNFAFVEMSLGNLDAADSVLSVALENAPDHLGLLTYSIDLAHLSGDLDAVEARADRLEAAHPEGEGAAIAEAFRGLVDAVGGRYAVALDHLAMAEQRARRAEIMAIAQAARRTDALIPQYTRGDTVETVRRLEAMLTDPYLLSAGPRQRGHIAIAGLLAQAGQGDRAEDVLDATGRAHEEAGLVMDEAEHAWARATIERAHGRYDAALRELERAEDLGMSPAPVHLERAFTHEAAGNPHGAIAAWEQALAETRGNRVPFDYVYFGFILQRLGELLDAQGETARAMEYYARFTELWADADAEFQPRVEAVRRRMAALSGEVR